MKFITHFFGRLEPDKQNQKNYSNPVINYVFNKESLYETKVKDHP